MSSSDDNDALPPSVTKRRKSGTKKAASLSPTSRRQSSRRAASLKHNYNEDALQDLDAAAAPKEKKPRSSRRPSATKGRKSGAKKAASRSTLPRRQPSRRAASLKRSYNEDALQVLDDAAAPKEKKKPRSSRRPSKKETKSPKQKRGPDSERKCPHCSRIFSIKEGLQYHLEHKVCQKEVSRKRKHAGKKSTSAKNKKQKKTADRGPASERTCPKCNKVFSIKEGLDYHMEHKVCERTPPVKQQTKRDNTKKGRTCPNCKRVFTVLWGLDYHVNHKVCQRESVLVPAFETLAPGKRFVTSWGVVEVVKDDRETPEECKIPHDIKLLSKRQSTVNSKREAKRKRRVMVMAIKTRLRREKLKQLHDKGEMTQGEVWNAYFDRDPTELSQEERSKRLPQEVPVGEDPLVPKNSYPDRIVECVLISDERRAVKGTEDDDDEEQAVDSDTKTASASVSPCGMRLFLKRRLLTQPYQSDTPLYICPDCGGKFGSKDGYVYHERNQVCANQAKARGEQIQERLQVVETSLQARLNPPVPLRSRRAKRKRVQEQNGVPQEVMEELGYRGDLSDEANVEQEEEKEVDVGELINPNDELEELQAEYDKYEAILAQQAKTENSKKKKKKRRRRRRRTMKPKPKPPAPPIIDTLVLLDEIDAGRFPSMKRFDGEHSDVCCICKKGGNMYCCDFCENVQHFGCILTKHTIKEPEPEEDFLCHKCINYMMAMRTRAEKRRLAKLNAASGEAAAASVESNENNEYYLMAKKGREVSELMELLRDAQSRLQQAVAVARNNDERRSLLDPNQVGAAQLEMMEEGEQE